MSFVTLPLVFQLLVFSSMFLSPFRFVYGFCVTFFFSPIHLSVEASRLFHNLSSILTN